MLAGGALGCAWLLLVGCDADVVGSSLLAWSRACGSLASMVAELGESLH